MRQTIKTPIKLLFNVYKTIKTNMKANQVQGQCYYCKLLTKIFSTKDTNGKNKVLQLKVKTLERMEGLSLYPFSEKNFKDSSRAPNFTLTL